MFLKPEKIFTIYDDFDTEPTPLVLWTDGRKKYLALSKVYKALGYDSVFNSKTSALIRVIKTQGFSLYYLPVLYGATVRRQYLCDVEEIIPILEAFIERQLSFFYDGERGDLLHYIPHQADNLITFFRRQE